MPYKIALLSKYFPLEGGIAAKTYWLARGLAARGHEVHIITHGVSAGLEYRIQDYDDCPSPKLNLQVHRSHEDIPWHIPEDNENTLGLLDLTIRVIREHEIQILDTGYLVPYGIVGHLSKALTGICHILRHGGSDIEKFFKKEILKTAVTEAISGADSVITEKHHKYLLDPINPRLVFQPSYIPDGSVFTSKGIKEPRRRLAFIGKINYHWQHKSLDYIARIIQELTGEFEILFISQGKGVSNFKETLDPELTSSFKWYPFMPPWKIPSLLDQIDSIFIFESKLPYIQMSNLALEALCSGVGIITDRKNFPDTYRDLMTIKENQVLLVDPSDHIMAAKMIKRWIQEQVYTHQSSRQLVGHNEWLSANEAVYGSVLNSH